MAFCDWITMRQRHPGGGAPVINGGCVVVIENNRPELHTAASGDDYLVIDDASVKFTTEKKIQHVGSFDTSVQIRSDGYTVEISGNVGRFGRPDNVYGYTVSECIERANRIVHALGLPIFCDDGIVYISSTDEWVPAPSSAIITRLDLTQNYFSGNPVAASRIVHFFGGHLAGRFAPKQYGSSGITWGEGSKYYSAKLYVKGLALGDSCTSRVRDHVTDRGMVRHEISLKSRYLTQHHLRTIHAWQQTKEGKTMDNVIYARFTDTLDREKNTVSVDDYMSIPGKAGDIAIRWRDGDDIWGSDRFKKSFKYKVRRELLNYGIDIKQPCDVTRLATKVKVITLEESNAPSWYWGESKTDWSKAA